MRRNAALLLLLTLLLPACDESTAPAPKEFFPDYLALGSTMSAGGASGGLTATSQQQAWPGILASRMSAVFFYPVVNEPGCPAPYTAPLVPATSGACAGRQSPGLAPHDLAVPNTRVADASVVPTGATGTLHALLVGSQSQLARMQALRPRMVSIQLGDDDALAAALLGTLGPASGPDSLLTPLAAFQASYAKVATAIIATGTIQRVVLVGVVDPVTTTAALQPGTYFFLARDPATARFNGKPVNANCSPITALGQPNPLAANKVAFAIIGDANFPEVNCDPAAYPVGDARRGTYLLDTGEQAVLRARVAAYNAAILATATTNNWAYVDPNAALASLIATKTAGGRYDNLRLCQDLPAATTAAQFQSATLNSCPATGATAAPNYFGSLMTFDGAMLSATAQTALANAVAVAVNARYGTTIPTS